MQIIVDTYYFHCRLNKQFNWGFVMTETFKKILDDEALASEDWKCLFLVTLLLHVIMCGFYLSGKLAEPIECCTPDYCSKY